MLKHSVPVLWLIDDDDGDSFLFSRKLKQYGLSNDIRRFKFPEEALRVIEEENEEPALLFLDVNFAGDHLDGLQFMKKLLASRLRFTKVIVLTGSSSDHDLARFLELGVIAYIKKSLGMEDLLFTLHRLGISWTIGG